MHIFFKNNSQKYIQIQIHIHNDTQMKVKTMNRKQKTKKQNTVRHKIENHKDPLDSSHRSSSNKRCMAHMIASALIHETQNTYTNTLLFKRIYDCILHQLVVLLYEGHLKNKTTTIYH